MTRHFGELRAVDGLTLAVERGEIVGLLGHNGAGKTTTVRLLNGVLSASAGSATVLGFDPWREGARLRRRTGVLTERAALDPRLSARETLRAYAALYGVPPREVARRVEGVLARVGLAERADGPTRGYSKGMRQRLALARATLHDPELLFLDEPTSGLDPLATAALRRQIHELADEGRTVLLCTHNLDEAQRLCHRVAVLRRGRLLALGTPSELAARHTPATPLELQLASEDRAAAVAVLDVAGYTATAPSEEAPRPGLARLRVDAVPRETVPELIAALVRAELRLFGVTSAVPSLEDVYRVLHDAGAAPGADRIDAEALS